MKIFRKNIFMCFAVLCALMFLSSPGFAAKAGFEKGGEVLPPYGATGDPGGTKLTGVMYIYYTDVVNNLDNYIAHGARFALRLQREKSSYPTVYYGTTSEDLDFAYPSSILATLYNILELEVERDYFNSEDMCFKIKSLKNEGLLKRDLTVQKDWVVIVDVEVAAKPYTCECYDDCPDEE